jgi:hypothetical protein
VTGVNGGYDVDVRRFAKEGVKVLGHVQGISDGTVTFASDANEILNEADKAFADFISAADKLQRESDLRPSLDVDGSLTPAGIAPTIDSIQNIDLRFPKVGAVVWATGHRFDFDWVHLPIFDPATAPTNPETWCDQLPGRVFSRASLDADFQVRTAVFCGRRCGLSGRTGGRKLAGMTLEPTHMSLANCPEC